MTTGGTGIWNQDNMEVTCNDRNKVMINNSGNNILNIIML